MVILVSYLWAAIGAALVYRILAAEQRRQLALIEAGQLEEIRTSVDPGMGAGICALFLIAAPAVLGRARGARGVAEGLGVLALAIAGNFVTLVALIVAAHVLRQ